MKYLSEYLEYLKYQKNYSDETIHSYSIDIEEFLDYINSECINICEVGYDVVKAWLIHLDEKKNKSTTVSRKISYLRGFYKYLINNKVMNSNPFSLAWSYKPFHCSKVNSILFQYAYLLSSS